MRTAIEGILIPFDYLGSFWGLTILSLLSGVGMLWVVGKTTPQKRVEHARNQMDSAVYEIRLFLDYPKRVVVSLGRLMLNSVFYVLYMMPAFVILAIPLTVMYLHLDTRHGMEAIATNEDFVVSIELANGVDGRSLAVTPSEGLEITAPPLYVANKKAVYLRAKASKVGELMLSLDLDGHTLTKTIVTDPTATQMTPDRSSGLNAWLSYGPEATLDGPITAISITHEPRDRDYLGITMPWWLWWLLLMMIAAFGLKKQLGVTL